MYIVTDQQKNQMAIIFKNILLSADGTKVMGIAIGDCLFNKNSKVMGKIINGYAYDVPGTIIGKVEPPSQSIHIELNQDMLKESWNILSAIKEHTCPWITLKTEWSLSSIADLLS
jgi:hypothetical protein